MATRRSAQRVADEELVPPLIFIPARVFFVSGTATHQLERVALQRAMREAGVADCNLVKVSSLIPPEARIIPSAEGRRLLHPGNIVHAVIAQAQTNEPHQRISTAIAWAKPDRLDVPGYIAELEEDLAKGKSAATAEMTVGEEALEIMAMRLRTKVDAKRAWERRGRSRTVRIGRTTVHTGSLSVSIVGPEEQDGESPWAAAFVAAIYV